MNQFNNQFRGNYNYTNIKDIVFNYKIGLN